MQTSLLFSLILPSLSDGFFLVNSNVSPRTPLVALQESRFWGLDNDDSFDIDMARLRFESLVGSSGGGLDKAAEAESASAPLTREYSPRRSDASSSLSTILRTTNKALDGISSSSSGQVHALLDVVLPPPPPMTTLERERRQAELKLLERLADGDQVLTDLWDFWFHERGSEAATRLSRAEELVGQGKAYWGQAEAILSALIEQYSVYWAEPVNRLATLYYLQGRHKEAETLCQIVLAVKPWHIGALSSIVKIYASLHEPEKARQWAAHRLPTFAPTGPNRRRQKWVHAATEESRIALEKGEQRIRDWIGPKDDIITLEDSWQ